MGESKKSLLVSKGMVGMTTVAEQKKRVPARVKVALWVRLKGGGDRP